LTINDASLRGSWQISLQSGNFYNILVSASSDLSFTSDLLTFDTSSSYGFSSVVGRPLKGVPLIAVFQASDTAATLTVEEINVVDSSGTIYEKIADILSLDSNAFAINFIPPDVPFRWQIVGRDEEGYTFSRISDTAIEVSDIDLSLGESETGFLVLQPGDNASVTITIFNSGGEASFTLNIETSVSGFVQHLLDSPTVTVGSNSTVDFLVRLSVFENATDGLASTFTVIARSTLDETNDFVTFQLTVSTRPPPEFTENDFGDSATTPTLSGAVLWLIISVAVGEWFLMMQEQ
jgi:hypothetical protein